MHSEVTMPSRTEGVECYKGPDVLDTLETPQVAHPANVEDSMHVGPAFHIPMTQEKSLHDLPSQLDFDFQDSLPHVSSASTATARSLVEELDVVSTPSCVPSDTNVEENKFGEVCNIAQEAAMVATQVDNPPQGNATVVTDLV